MSKDDNFMRLEDAIEIVIKTAKDAVSCTSKTHDMTGRVNTAIRVVEDFFVNNVFDDEKNLADYVPGDTYTWGDIVMLLNGQSVRIAHNTVVSLKKTTKLTLEEGVDE